MSYISFIYQEEEENPVSRGRPATIPTTDLRRHRVGTNTHTTNMKYISI